MSPSSPWIVVPGGKGSPSTATTTQFLGAPRPFRPPCALGCPPALAVAFGVAFAFALPFALAFAFALAFGSGTGTTVDRPDNIPAVTLDAAAERAAQLDIAPDELSTPRQSDILYTAQLRNEACKADCTGLVPPGWQSEDTLSTLSLIHI